MYRILILPLFMLTSFTTSASVETRKDCVLWERSLSTVVVDTKESVWKIKTDKKIEDLLTIIKSYPSGIPVDFTQDSKEPLLERVRKLEDTPVCSDISYYVALETLVNYPGADPKIKKKLLKNLFERTNRSKSDKVTFFYTMITQLEIQKLIEKKVMAVNDIQYFELGRIGDEIQKTKLILEQKSLRDPEDQKCVAKLSACSTEQLHQFYDLYRTEGSEASRLYLQLAFWVHRVKPSLL